MATAKKVTPKKNSKKIISRKTSPKRVKKTQFKSFKISPETFPFITFKITEQTFYWSILLMSILALALWSLSIQISISNILNSIKTTI